MEDIKAYIESGILELFVLGDLTHDEKLQVEAMALKHPAIKAELDEIEQSLALYAKNNAVEPADHLRDKVLRSMVADFEQNGHLNATSQDRNSHVVALPVAKTINFYKYAFAACLALLLASVFGLVSLYNKLQQSNNQIAALQTDKQRFASVVSLKDGELEVLQDKSFRFLNLKGTANAPAANITVAWSPVKKKVWIDMKSIKMPVNDEKHQYQLWALVDGKPVDLGVFDRAASDTSDMKEMKSIVLADAFAVTLEPRGGSVSPTLSEMMVVGKF